MQDEESEEAEVDGAPETQSALATVAATLQGVPRACYATDGQVRPKTLEDFAMATMAAAAKAIAAHVERSGLAASTKRRMLSNAGWAAIHGLAGTEDPVAGRGKKRKAVLGRQSTASSAHAVRSTTTAVGARSAAGSSASGGRPGLAVVGQPLPGRRPGKDSERLALALHELQGHRAQIIAWQEEAYVAGHSSIQLLQDLFAGRPLLVAHIFKTCPGRFNSTAEQEYNRQQLDRMVPCLEHVVASSFHDTPDRTYSHVVKKDFDEIGPTVWPALPRVETANLCPPLKRRREYYNKAIVAGIRELLEPFDSSAKAAAVVAKVLPMLRHHLRIPTHQDCVRAEISEHAGREAIKQRFFPAACLDFGDHQLQRKIYRLLVKGCTVLEAIMMCDARVMVTPRRRRPCTTPPLPPPAHARTRTHTHTHTHTRARRRRRAAEARQDDALNRAERARSQAHAGCTDIVAAPRLSGRA